MYNYDLAGPATFTYIPNKPAGVKDVDIFIEAYSMQVSTFEEVHRCMGDTYSYRRYGPQPSMVSASATILDEAYPSFFYNYKNFYRASRVARLGTSPPVLQLGTTYIPCILTGFTRTLSSEIIHYSKLEIQMIAFGLVTVQAQSVASLDYNQNYGQIDKIKSQELPKGASYVPS